MADEPTRGPRDWEPTDPRSPWWNPKPGDPYGPSDQEHRQPWEGTAPVRRFPGSAGASGPPLDPPPLDPPPLDPPASPPPPPAENHPQTDLLLGVGFLALIVLLIGCGLGVFVEDWRRGAGYTMIGAFALLGTALVLAAAGTLRRATAIGIRPVAARIGYDGLAALVVLLVPAGMATILITGQWLPGGYLPPSGLAIALAAAIAASAVRERVEKFDQGATPPRLVAQVAQGSVLFGLVVVCVGGVVAGGVFGYNRINDDGLTDQGSLVPAVAIPVPSPTWTALAPTAADPVPRVRHDLEGRVLLVARVAQPVTSRCVRVDSGAAGTEIQYTCTVTYADHDIVFAVIGSGRRQTGELGRYEAKADRVVVTRDGLHAQLREAYPRAEELRCDPFPELALVATAAPLPQRCYLRDQGARRFVLVTLTPRDNAPPTFAQPAP